MKPAYEPPALEFLTFRIDAPDGEICNGMSLPGDEIDPFA